MNTTQANGHAMDIDNYIAHLRSSSTTRAPEAQTTTTTSEDVTLQFMVDGRPTDITVRRGTNNNDVLASIRASFSLFSLPFSGWG